MLIILIINMPLIHQLLRRFNLVLCELHYTPIHGKSDTNCIISIEGQYLLIAKFSGTTGILLDEDEGEDDEYDTDTEYISEDDEDEDEDEDDNSITYLYHIQRLYKGEYAAWSLNRQEPHKLIRNYHNIVGKTDYIKPEIAECFELPTGEQIVIIKTIWIKIIQRKWKKIFAAKQHIIKCRLCPSSISTRQLTGMWPQHCILMPSLKGMLSNLL